MLLEIEGVDGVGKSTQCSLLKLWLENQGKSAVIVKDLESTSLGQNIKSVLVTDATRSREVELFSFLACKSHLFRDVFHAGAYGSSHVICDRGIGSFLSYFEALGYERDFLQNALNVALPENHTPTTILLDVEIDVALQRNLAKTKQSKFDKMGVTFFQRQRDIYRELADNNSWHVIDAHQNIPDVHEAVKQYITPVLAG